MAAMMGPDFAFLFALMLGGPFEVTSLVDAEDYFRHREIAVDGDKLIRLAGTDPTGPEDGKGRLAQLLAIRTLGERKEAKARKLLEDLAGGSAKAANPFAADWAAAALAEMDGKPRPAEAVPKDSARKTALEWFPADVDVFGALDLRGLPRADSEATRPLRGMMFKNVDRFNPDFAKRQRDEFYGMLEAVGPLRIDRAAFAFADVPAEKEGDRGNSRLYFRFTGRGDGKAFAKFASEKFLRGGGAAEEDKAAGFTVVAAPDRAPVFAIAGDAELLAVGYDRGRGNHREVYDAVVAVKAGKKPAVTKGVFTKDLAAFSESAAGVLAGSTNKDLARMLAGSPLGAAPQNFTLELTADGKGGLKLKGTAAFDDAEAAKRVVETLKTVRTQAVDALKNPPPGVTADVAKQTSAALEAAEAKSADATVTVELPIPAELLKALPGMIKLATERKDE
jgi:hypothetical protein